MAEGRGQASRLDTKKGGGGEQKKTTGRAYDRVAFP